MVPSGPGRGSLAVKSALSHRVLLVELIETGPEVDVTVLFGLTVWYWVTSWTACWLRPDADEN